MIEEGTREEFKRCILDQLWTWELSCGHTIVCAGDFRAEFESFEKGLMRCPRCVPPNDGYRTWAATPENAGLARAFRPHDH